MRSGDYCWVFGGTAGFAAGRAHHSSRSRPIVPSVGFAVCLLHLLAGIGWLAGGVGQLCRRLHAPGRRSRPACRRLRAAENKQKKGPKCNVIPSIHQHCACDVKNTKMPRKRTRQIAMTRHHCNAYEFQPRARPAPNHGSIRRPQIQAEPTGTRNTGTHLIMTNFGAAGRTHFCCPKCKKNEPPTNSI